MQGMIPVMRYNPITLCIQPFPFERPASKSPFFPAQHENVSPVRARRTFPFGLSETKERRTFALSKAYCACSRNLPKRRFHA